MSEKLEEAMFGAGCFWGVQQTFDSIKGVKETEVGYSGGSFENPSYEDVCSGTTGHAEVVHLKFDPQEVSFEDLLRVFWKSHNPTTVNRQGPDIGSQYRSAVFYYGDEQRAAAEKKRDELNATGGFGSQLVTEIMPAGVFYKAEDHHQKYFEKRGGGQCH